MLSESVLRPRYELLYHLSPVLSQCVAAAAGESCVGLYRFSVANSGLEAQERVRVAWPAQFAGWQVDWDSSDLVASAQSREEPEIGMSKDGQFAHEIRNLAPNTLVEFAVRCGDCTRAELEAARQAAVHVEAHGKLLEGEPRMTVLGRAATNAARVVGIFF